MNHFALGTKVWQKAVKENNRLILENSREGDIQTLARDNGWKTIAQATDKMNEIILRVLSFRENQKRKNSC